jgi:ubiquinone/menaquinone biosynthesis C-methylase UbiE
MNIETYARKHPKHKPGVILPQNLERMGFLADRSRILDIGCAEGYTIRWLQSKFSGRYRFVGIDLSKTRILDAVGQQIPNASFCLGSAEDLPLPSNSVDFVTASQVIEHVPDDTRMLSEIERVLTHGGIFQIDTVYKKKWARYIYRSPIGWALDPTHQREYTDLDALLVRFPAALKIENIQIIKTYRALNILSVFSSFPDWLKIRIPGYFTLFISGCKL